MIIGKILDSKYEILELIGQGGMARVYKARDKRLNRDVAVKVLKNEFADNEQFLKKFLREAQADAKLAHPNIVNVYDVGVEGGYYYIVMEYIDGKTLNNFIKTNKKIPAQETVNLILQIAAGLQHAHKNNIIHRDIKPHNILLTSAKTPKVADFGIARAITSSTVTATEEALGSVHYISPEQARGGFLDERSDLYSLGIMMYEMLTGELPFNGETPVAVALKHVQNNVPSPKDKVKTIPESLNQIVLNLTRRKPDDRYQNTDDLIADLKKISGNFDVDIQPTYNAQDFPEQLISKEDRKTSKIDGKKKSVFKNKKFLLYTATGLVVLGIMAYAVIIGYLGKKIEVPNVVGMSIEEASSELAKAGLKYEISDKTFSKDIEKDIIISQTPEGSEYIRANIPVKLEISMGPSTASIPDVKGKYEKEAQSILTNAGFVVKEIIYKNNDEYKSGTVFDQNPAGNTEAKEGTEVTLYISKGKDSVSMPKVTGMTLASARTTITDSGLIVGNITYEPSDSFAKDTVIRQTPTAFSEVSKNSRVDLVVSQGKLVSKTITINLANYTSGISGDTVSVRVDLMDTSGDNVTTVYAQNNNKNDVINVTMQGVGNKIYKLYINGTEKYSGVISFS